MQSLSGMVVVQSILCVGGEVLVMCVGDAILCVCWWLGPCFVLMLMLWFLWSASGAVLIVCWLCHSDCVLVV